MKGKMKKLLAAVMAMALLANIPAAVWASPNEVTPSGIAFNQVGAAIEEWAEEHPDDYVSFATAVFKEDEIIYQNGFGYKDRENGIEADTDTVYEWGSISKTLVWVSVMQLWEKGQLDLEKDIREYLPDNFLRKLKYDEPITMLHLMNHTGGWSENVWAFQTGDENKVKSLGEVLQETEPVQIYRPGEVSSYSNYGAALAGYVVECITKQSFHEYVHENIFTPLGMEHTALLPTHKDNDWVYEKRKETVCYTNTGKNWVSTGSQLVYILPYPAGAATGNITDLAIYAGALARKDCPLFEKPETRKFLFSPSALFKGTDVGYSYHGFMTSVIGENLLLGHNGGTNGFASHMFFDEGSGVGTVIMMTGTGLPITEIPEIIYGKASTDIPVNLMADKAESNDISGMYIGARSMAHGPLKLMSLLGILPVVSSKEGSYDVAGIATIENIFGEFYWIVQNGQGFPMEGYRLEDGTGVLNLGLQSYVESPTLVVEIALLIFYALCALVSIILLFIKLICFAVKKYKKYEGSKFIIIGQIGKIVSVGIVVFWVSVYPTQYGLTPTQAIIGCVVQMLCVGTYLVAAGASCKGLFSKEAKKKTKALYVVNIIANVICVAAVISLELIRFWNV